MKFKKAVKLLTRAAKELYTRNTTTQYHNWQHAKQVRKHALKLLKTEDKNEKLTLELAAIWHDAYYVVGNGIGENEKATSALLGGAWMELTNGESPLMFLNQDAAVMAARNLIEWTSIDTHLTDTAVGYEPLACLLDADLRSLAFTSYAKFEAYQHKIIKEVGADPYNVEHKLKSAEFLQKFLQCREFIYHTHAARAKWEAKARRNILAYLADARDAAIKAA